MSQNKLITEGHGEWSEDYKCTNSWVKHGNSIRDGIYYQLGRKLDDEDRQYRCEWEIYDREQMAQYYAEKQRKFEDGYDDEEMEEEEMEEEYERPTLC